MKNIFISICLLAIMTSHAQAESLYRWVDKDGKVHYGDRPAEDAVGAQQKKFGAPVSAGDDDLPYSVRKAKQDFPVILYVSANCGDLCVQARSFLNKRGVPFTEKNIVTKEDAEEFKAKSGGDSVPVLFVGKSMSSGFAAEPWSAALDIAGYPQTAPYASRTNQPAAAKPEAPVTPEK